MFDVPSLLHRQHPMPTQESIHLGSRLAEVLDLDGKHLPLHSSGWLIADFTKKIRPLRELPFQSVHLVFLAPPPLRTQAAFLARFTSPAPGSSASCSVTH